MIFTILDSYEFSDLDASRARLNSIEAELTRLRGARRAAEEGLEQERGNAGQLEALARTANSGLRDYFRSSVETSLMHLATRLRFPAGLGCMGAGVAGVHLLVPTDMQFEGFVPERGQLYKQ